MNVKIRLIYHVESVAKLRQLFGELGRSCSAMAGEHRRM